jgi:hypothetical protein
MEQQTRRKLDAVKVGPLESGVSAKREGKDILSKGMRGSYVRGTGEVNIMSEYNR